VIEFPRGVLRLVYHNPGVLHYASWFASRCQVLGVSSVDR
jgi:hypothetical protein